LVTHEIAMNIFVANINFKTRKEDLETTFQTYGEVASVKLVKDRDTGRAKGYGFVEMPNDAEALKAIEGLNGFQLDGRELIVKPANSSTKGQESAS
jgi:RNA recognition motif-containing protein